LIPVAGVATSSAPQRPECARDREFSVQSSPTGHAAVPSVVIARRLSLQDCLLPFDFRLPNDAGCRKETLAVFRLTDRSTLEAVIGRTRSENTAAGTADVRRCPPSRAVKPAAYGCFRKARTGAPDRGCVKTSRFARRARHRPLRSRCIQRSTFSEGQEDPRMP